jgi:hypothetical protein
MPVEPLAGYSEENIAGLHLPGIDTHPMDPGFRGTAAQLSGTTTDNELQGACLHVQLDPRRGNAPNGATASAGNGRPKSTNSNGISRTRISETEGGPSVRSDPGAIQSFSFVAATNK